MTKAELVEEVARAAELTKKDSEVIVEEVFKNIIQALNRGEKIELRGLSTQWFSSGNHSSRASTPRAFSVL